MKRYDVCDISVSINLVTVSTLFSCTITLEWLHCFTSAYCSSVLIPTSNYLSNRMCSVYPFLVVY